MKSLVPILVLLSLAVAMVPAPRVFAASSSTVIVSPASTFNVPPSTFTISVNLTNVLNLIGYSIDFTYNSTVLIAVRGPSGGPWNQGKPVITLQNVTTQSIGDMKIAQVLAGAAVNITNSVLFTEQFQYQGFGSSPLTVASVLLSGVCPISGVLSNGVACTPGNVLLLPAPGTVNAVASTPPPSSADLTNWQSRPESHHVKLSVTSLQTLDSDVANTGTTTAFVQVRYFIVSGTGTQEVDTAITSILPGSKTSTVITVSYFVPSLPQRYFVLAVLFVSGDGHFFLSTGATKSFSFAVVS